MSRTADPKCSGRFRFVCMVPFIHFQDVASRVGEEIDLVACSTPRSCAGAVGDFRRQILNTDSVVVGENLRPVDRILQLTNVPRPNVFFERRHDVRFETPIWTGKVLD